MTSARALTASRGMSIGILLADDHALVREALARLLEAEPDLEILALASDGHEAWEFVEALVPSVAILDLSMPGINGIEVARRTVAVGLGTSPFKVPTS